MTNNAHAKLAPSAADRWMRCPGSIALTDKVVPYGRSEESTPAQAEGTLAHDYCEKLLLGTIVPADVPEDMLPGVAFYIEEVSHRITEFGKGTKMHVEKKLRNPMGSPDVYGTADCVLISKDKKRMAVIDFKYGRMPVVAEDNMQLITYATLAAGHFGVTPKKVDLIIVQPRAMDNLGPVRTASITKKELRLYEAQINAAAELALSPAGAQMYSPGEKQCQWCPAAGHCSAQAKQGAIADFFEGPPPTAILSVEQMAEMMDGIAQVDAYINQLKKAAFERAMADETLPGWKLVHKKTIRKWDDAKAVEALLKKNKIDAAIYLEPAKLKSFTKLEKLNETADLVKEHIIKPVGELQLAPDADPREEAGPGDDFADDLK